MRTQLEQKIMDKANCLAELERIGQFTFFPQFFQIPLSSDSYPKAIQIHQNPGHVPRHVEIADQCFRSVLNDALRLYKERLKEVITED